MDGLNYPDDVVGEWGTLLRVVDGKSIARYGDGEFNLVRGGNCVSQRMVPGIQVELQNILHSKDPNLLVAIPRLDKRSPKNVNWLKCCAQYGSYLKHSKQYYSAFITRPDSAPWISTPSYYDFIESLWKGQEVTFVGNGQRSLTADFLMETGARSVHYVECDYAHTYPRIDALERACLKPMGNEKPRRVLLCAGPTATCLAARLSRQGVQAIDLGHIGMWWRAYDNPKLTPYLRILG